jgi:hypothetical protein
MSSLLLKSNFHTDLVNDNEGQYGAVYDLRYDPKNGNVELVNQGAGLFGNPGVILFQNGDWTPEGLKIIPANIIRDNYKIEIQIEVRTAHKNIGGNAANNILPSWAQASQQAGPPLPSAPATGGGDPFNLNIADLKSDFQFGSVDENLKKTDLQYPKDALYNKTQDYLQIGQYHYRPPKSDELFGRTDGAVKILKTGLQKTSALAKFLGIVKLPMPNSVSDSNNVSWGDDNMNNLSAAATAEIVGNLGTYLGASGVGALVGLIAGNAQQGAALGAQGALLYKLLSNGGADSQAAQALLKTAGASKVLSMAGFSVSPESILARGFGVVPNSNLELLFNSPTLREFTFQYRMSPRSKEEATDINKIIRFFKQGMAAKKQDKRSGNQEYGTAGASSYFLGTPNVFQLQYKTSNGNPIQGVNRIKTCALVGFSMNYTADGTWAAYDDGQPVSVIMNMSFKELEPIYDTDYQSSIFDERKFVDNIDNSGDLYPISPNDVGY